MTLYAQIHLSARFFQALSLLVGIAIAAYLWSPMLYLLPLLLGALLLLLALDAHRLFSHGQAAISAERLCGKKFSNGDPNPVQLLLCNYYPFPTKLLVLEELPVQFQERHMQFSLRADAGATEELHYELSPVERGSYQFGCINVLAQSPLGLLMRHFRAGASMEVSVYPSFMQMRHYELLAVSNRLSQIGLKKVRRAGTGKEFEQIDPYVRGDEYRRINWKATARRNELMVNRFQDERSQKIYCLIDKGRSMEMPFSGLSLLDYAINASLVLSNIALQRKDQAGLITFQEKVNKVVPASSRPGQLNLIMEMLYREKTDYRESDLEAVYNYSERQLGSRSLLLLFTNYESLVSLRRQIPLLRLLSRKHLLVTILFRNVEVERLVLQKAEQLRDIYEKGLAEELMYQKYLMVKELQAAGLPVLLTTPARLTADTLNKYLEIKSRGAL